MPFIKLDSPDPSFKDDVITWMTNHGVICINCGKFISIIPRKEPRLCGCPLEEVEDSI